MLRGLFFALLPLALLGDARVFLFVLNRVVFGNHREEKSPWNWLIYTVPPVLLLLTLLFYPLHKWIAWLLERNFVDSLTPDVLERLIWLIPLAKLGAAWLLIASAIGVYWIVDRTRLLVAPPPRARGTHSSPSEVVRIRKGQMPRPLQKIGVHNDVYDIEVTRHEIFIENLAQEFDGYRIAFLTDTHVAGFVRRAFYREVVAQTNRFEPDLILLGGDFVTWNRHISLMAEVLLPELKPRDGVLAVLGNHDYWAGGEEVKNAMTAKGVKFIINTSTVIRRGSAELPVVGVDEVYRGEPDVEKAFSGVRAGKPCIGVTHHPDLIDHLDGRHLDLLVCGHTHGGQIRFPFFGAIVIPSRHEGRYAQGFHRVGDVLMYVSRGIGAIPPLRILCKPEVATFVLRRARR